MARKLLFVLFTDEPCKRNHAFMYAIALHRQGHAVRLILEGLATRSFAALGEQGSSFAALFQEAKALGLVAGACRKAASGCASNDPARQVSDLVQEQGVALLDGMNGHADIEPLVREGYELVVF